MARIKHQKLLIQGDIEPPFPSSPTRPPRYNLYVGRRNIVSLYALYAAHRCFETIVNERSYRWIDDETIITTDGEVKIKSSSLKEIANYKPTAKEQEWVTPEPYYSEWRRLGGKVSPKREPEPEPAPTETKSKPKPKPTGGVVTIAELAAEYKMTPTRARKVLRAAGVSKPYRWDDYSELNNIKKLLSKS